MTGAREFTRRSKGHAGKTLLRSFCSVASVVPVRGEKLLQKLPWECEARDVKMRLSSSGRPLN
jgi:hypothetical protein